MVSESKSLTGCKKVKRTAFIRGGYKVNKLKRLSMLTVMIASVFIFSSHALAAQYYTVSTSSGAPVNMRSGRYKLGNCNDHSERNPHPDLLLQNRYNCNWKVWNE